jgi:hypothetical protein
MRSLMESVDVDFAPNGTVVRMERRLGAQANGHGAAEGDA